MQKTEIRLPELAPSVSHYTDGVRAGDFIFISGMAALDSKGNVLAEGDVVQQTKHTLDAIGEVLRAAGGTFSDIVKVTVYLTDVNNRPLINSIRKKYFAESPPTSVFRKRITVVSSCFAR